MSRSFNGSTNLLQVASPVLTAAPISIAAWFKVNNVTANHTLLCLADTAGANNYFSLTASGGTALDPVTANTRTVAGAVAATAGTFTAGGWNHGAAVFASSTSRKAYLNGTVGTEETSSRTPAGLDVTSIGALTRNTNADFTNGLIGYVAVWDLALSDGEVATLAGGALPDSVQPGNLIGYWPLTSNTDPEPDEAGTADMAVTGATFSADDPPVSGGGVVLARAKFMGLTGVA